MPFLEVEYSRPGKKTYLPCQLSWLQLTQYPKKKCLHLHTSSTMKSPTHDIDINKATFLEQFYPRGKGAISLCLHEAAPYETRQGHNTGNGVPYSLR